MFPSNGLARYTKLGEADELILNEEYAKEIMGKIFPLSMLLSVVHSPNTSKI